MSSIYDKPGAYLPHAVFLTLQHAFQLLSASKGIEGIIIEQMALSLEPEKLKQRNQLLRIASQLLEADGWNKLDEALELWQKHKAKGNV